MSVERFSMHVAQARWTICTIVCCERAELARRPPDDWTYGASPVDWSALSSTGEATTTGAGRSTP